MKQPLRDLEKDINSKRMMGDFKPHSHHWLVQSDWKNQDVNNSMEELKELGLIDTYKVHHIKNIKHILLQEPGDILRVAHLLEHKTSVNKVIRTEVRSIYFQITIQKD